MSKNTTGQELAVTSASSTTSQITAFASESGFESAQRMARALVSSKLVPTTFQGDDNIGSALIALEIAQRLGASPLMVMQNLNVINGRPAWSSQFIIAALNSCGRFSPIRFDVTGTGDDQSCIAWAYDKATGDRLEGPPCSITTAKKEGWFSKTGSKWQTMPELMLRYRAAAFFGRLYAPDLLMGMQSVEEVTDVNGAARTAAARKEGVKVTFKDEAPAPAEDIIEGEVIAEVLEEPTSAMPTTKKELGVMIKAKMDAAGIPKEKLLAVMVKNDLAPEGCSMLNQLSAENMQIALLNWEKITSQI
jgi:hypothetical protein